VCIVRGERGDATPLVDSASTEHQLSDSLHRVAILHDGVAQVVFTPGIGSRLLMHGIDEITCLMHPIDDLLMGEARAADEVLSSGHRVCLN